MQAWSVQRPAPRDQGCYQLSMLVAKNNYNSYSLQTLRHDLLCQASQKLRNISCAETFEVYQSRVHICPATWPISSSSKLGAGEIAAISISAAVSKPASKRRIWLKVIYCEQDRIVAVSMDHAIQPGLSPPCYSARARQLFISRPQLLVPCAQGPARR